jgi:hypothetical protein
MALSEPESARVRKAVHGYEPVREVATIAQFVMKLMDPDEDGYQRQLKTAIANVR